MRRLAACLVILLLAASPAFAAPFPVGRWFGSGQPYDKSAMYLDQMLANGDYHGHFRRCVQGKAQDQLEIGTWSLVGNSLTIRIATVNGQLQRRVDSYRIVSHDAQTQSYVYLPLNFPYTSRLVAGDFQMPGCELIS
jgi:hypothetical protein